MSYRQRRVLSSDSHDAEPTDQLWPTDDSYAVTAAAGLPAAASVPWVDPSDQYVTVDERVGGVVGVVAADWPTVDQGGLRFGGEISSAWFDEADLQSTVDRWRDAVGQLRRPLRIGDTFWIRGYRPSSTESWDDLRDITIHARSMAKAGVALVAVGVVDVESPVVADLDVSADDVTESPPESGRNQPPPSGAATASPVF
jgi:hypothetical protein